MTFQGLALSSFIGFTICYGTSSKKDPCSVLCQFDGPAICTGGSWTKDGRVCHAYFFRGERELGDHCYHSSLTSKTCPSNGLPVRPSDVQGLIGQRQSTSQRSEASGSSVTVPENDTQLELVSTTTTDEPTSMPPTPSVQTQAVQSGQVYHGNPPFVSVQPAIFVQRGTEGDFAWMIQQPQYSRALFIFNDNEEQYLAFASGDRTSRACGAGGGNAAIRPYQCLVPPKAVGVPTGAGGSGYRALDERTKRIIDQSLDGIRSLITTGHYDKIIFSRDGLKNTLGTGIFNPSADVKDYIYHSLNNLL